MHTLLRGIVGSTAYGLNGPNSDIDRLGVFAYDTYRLFNMSPPPDSMVTTNPDITMHEVSKAAKLLLSCNPTVTEILWLPGDLYEFKAPLGDELIGLRHAFLSAKKVKDAYMGYATQQFKRLLNRGDGKFDSDTGNRTAKHARHLKRLVTQGLELYTTNNLIIRLENPQSYLDFGDMVAKDPESVIPFMSRAEDDFKAAVSVLAEDPRPGVVQGWINRVRREFYQKRDDE